MTNYSRVAETNPEIEVDRFAMRIVRAVTNGGAEQRWEVSGTLRKVLDTRNPALLAIYMLRLELGYISNYNDNLTLEDINAMLNLLKDFDKTVSPELKFRQPVLYVFSSREKLRLDTNQIESIRAKLEHLVAGRLIKDLKAKEQSISLDRGDLTMQHHRRIILRTIDAIKKNDNQVERLLAVMTEAGRVSLMTELTAAGKDNMTCAELGKNGMEYSSTKSIAALALRVINILCGKAYQDTDSGDFARTYIDTQHRHLLRAQGAKTFFSSIIGMLSRGEVKQVLAPIYVEEGEKEQLLALITGSPNEKADKFRNVFEVALCEHLDISTDKNERDSSANDSLANFRRELAQKLADHDRTESLGDDDDPAATAQTTMVDIDNQPTIMAKTK